MPYFVADPGGVHVFKPDGGHVMVGHPSGAVTKEPKKGKKRRRR